MARLERIWIKRAARGPMDPADRARLVEAGGIEGNADFGPARRQVTVISADRWAEVVRELGADVDPSARRANLLVSGVDLENSRGRTLRVGACRLLVRGETRPCANMDAAYQGLQAALRPHWRGGAWADVVAGGDIAVGDQVAFESSPDLP